MHLCQLQCSPNKNNGSVSMLRHLEIVHSPSKVKYISGFYICDQIEMFVLIICRQKYLMQVQLSFSIQDVVCRHQHQNSSQGYSIIRLYETVNFNVCVVPTPLISHT